MTLAENRVRPGAVDPRSAAPDETFGSYLRFLRRRARLTQTELSIAVGYSSGHISMLESDRRLPDVVAIPALFFAALALRPDSAEARQLQALAKAAHQPTARRDLPTTATYQIEQIVTHEAQELGQLEPIPVLPPYYVTRSGPVQWLRRWLPLERQVAIVGLPGMGKSTLAASFAREYATQHPVLWITLVAGVNQAAEAILRQLALFIITNAHPHSTLASNISSLQRYLTSERTKPSGQAASTHLLTLIATSLQALAAPLLVMDDAHLLVDDPAMLALWQQLTQLAPTAHTLFVTRCELPLPTVANLTLAGLEETEADQLIHKLTARPLSLPKGAGGSAGELVEPANLPPLAIRHSGNPLLLRLALSQLEQEPRPSAANADAERLVGSIVDSLPEPARHLLELLAVCRSPVDLHEPQLAELFTRRLPRYNHTLAQTTLYQRRLIDHPQRALPHMLLREPVVAALDRQPDHRHQIHQLAAQWAEMRSEWVEAAHHYCALGAVQTACDLLTEQSEVLRNQGKATVAAAVADAILQRARQNRHNPTGQEVIRRTLLLRGDLLLGTLHSAEAYASYRAAMEITGDRTARAAIAERMAASLVQSGQAQDALDLCDEAERMLGLTPTTDAIKLRVQFGGTRVRALFHLSRFGEARKVCEQAVNAGRLVRLLLPRLADQIQASGYLGMAYAAKRLGNHPEAHQLLLRSVKAAQAAGLRELEVEGLTFLSAVAREEQGFAQAEQYGSQALAVAESIGNLNLVADALHYLSFNDYYAYNLERALVRSQRAGVLKEQMNDSDGLAACEAAQAIILGEQGLLAVARRTGDRAVATSLLCSNAWLQGITLYAHGVVASFQADHAVAEASLRAALARPAFYSDTSFRVGAELYLGMVYVAQGRLAEAAVIAQRPLPVGTCIQEEHQRDLLLTMLAYGQNRLAEACQVAQRLQAHATQTGYRVYAVEAGRMAQLIDQAPPLVELPRLVCCLPIAPPPSAG